MKNNCWEIKKCGREEGGSKVREFGTCRASTETIYNGIHNGKNAGRCCWALAGTYCEGKPQGTYAAKIGDCVKCDFYKDVFNEEGEEFMFTREILGYK